MVQCDLEGNWMCIGREEDDRFFCSKKGKLIEIPYHIWTQMYLGFEDITLGRNEKTYKMCNWMCIGVITVVEFHSVTGEIQ